MEDNFNINADVNHERIVGDWEGVPNSPSNEKMGGICRTSQPTHLEPHYGLGSSNGWFIIILLVLLVAAIMFNIFSDIKH